VQIKYHTSVINTVFILYTMVYMFRPSRSFSGPRRTHIYALISFSALWDPKWLQVSLANSIGMYKSNVWDGLNLEIRDFFRSRSILKTLHIKDDIKIILV